MSEVTRNPAEKQSATLPTLARKANRAHIACETAIRSALEHAKRCGEILIQAKGLVGRGNFQGWIKQHCDFPPHAARSYMKRAIDRATETEAQPDQAQGREARK
jgi:hypothetical protein